MFRKPVATDGPVISGLIAACPPLDPNSAYCNLLQCTDFADSCIIAERGGEVVGWVRQGSLAHAEVRWHQCYPRL